MDVKTPQIAAAFFGIGTVILCRRQKKNVDSEKSGLSRVVSRRCIKEAVCLCLTAY